MKALKEIKIINGERGVDISDEEIQKYVDMGREKYKHAHAKMEGINITLDGEEVEIEWIFETKPFDRIRRITGYLVGTLDRFNDAKRKEVEERVKHGIDSIQSDMDDVCLTDEELANL